jgi:cell division protein ZapA
MFETHAHRGVTVVTLTHRARQDQRLSDRLWTLRLEQKLRRIQGEIQMEKQKITVSVAGKNYTLVSNDPPEFVRRVAAFVDRKLSETAAVTNLPSGQAAVLTCFNLAEELLKAQDENTVLHRQNEQLARTSKQEAKEKNSKGSLDSGRDEKWEQLTMSSL